LDDGCSIKQADQLAITKDLEALEKIDILQNTSRAATIFIDSRITIDSIRNTRKHNHIVEEIRKKMTSLERADWNIEISWVKYHLGIVGNELADRLAKAAACDSTAKIVFNRLPMNTLINKIEEETKVQWPKEWKECTKAGITKEFLPTVHGRQKININITPLFTEMVAGHGKTRAYLHRFKILEHANCPFGNGDENINNLHYRCSILHKKEKYLNVVF